jgi:hypothetical protein
MRDLLTIVPTRGRPGNMGELIEAWLATIGGNSDLMFVADGDDPDWPAYFAYELPNCVSLLTIGARPDGSGGMPRALNLAAENYWDAYRYLGFMGDDHRPRTPGWDSRYVEALDAMGGIGVVYGDDTVQGPNIPTQCAMSSAIPKALGYFCPPGFRHLYLDNVWKLWGESIGRLKYLPNVIVEHLHPVAGKAEWDQHYRDRNAPAVTEHDHAAWRAYSEAFHALDGDLSKLLRLEGL